MAQFTKDLGAMAKAAVSKIDPNMANMNGLIESTRKSLCDHYKNEAVKEINCPRSSLTPASPLAPPSVLAPPTPTPPPNAGMMNPMCGMGGMGGMGGMMPGMMQG
mmetsp:Transcript_14977/g.20311  ORF Transcript_14977/g.20311 Transcript_14977/m.20311 type:complete len:105 (+) Transcript_14977:296-610(+)|eukprot:CAMPEP_0185569146 /NCGR_PEP_ID=MMETSP0434-20130131/1865_1 /TAXON_ID=626734 ORGANISM="Favella taraikaensis, Strain Fe Narragansett Bay" /NCGR_SAMPLE_ID=MMETSP0434 /ASSEMBLY_ACC=CAM_ASM_000379 /LENGTH=104 /DNA_ID=CAMNT_0028183845 /DNA_START=255 /DNA_END=569 /DNA_ORIENTATION=-